MGSFCLERIDLYCGFGVYVVGWFGVGLKFSCLQFLLFLIQVLLRYVLCFLVDNGKVERYYIIYLIWGRNFVCDNFYSGVVVFFVIIDFLESRINQ